MRAVVDLQVLQCPTAPAAARRRNIGLAGLLAAEGRLAAGLFAPEDPAPGDALALGPVEWDGMTTARRLGAAGPIARVVAEPFLHLDPGAPARIVGMHWTDLGAPLVVCVGSLVELTDPDRYLPSRGLRERYLARAEWAATADLLLVDSDDARRIAIETLGAGEGRVGVWRAWPAVTPAPDHDGPTLGGPVPSEDRPFVLIPGMDRIAVDRSIDLGALLAPLWSALEGVDAGVVVAGELPGAPPGCTRVDPASVPALYGRAALTVVPHPLGWSDWAGAEARAGGSPAVVGPDDLSRIGDILAGAAVPTAGTGAVTASWPALLDSLGAPPSLKGPARVALVGPYPPHGGGIGAYNDRVLRAMTAFARPDAVPTTWTGWRPPPGAGVTYVESFGVDVRPAAYDAVVYTLGNSHGHLPAVEAALRHPGWLWLHETRLPAIATTTFERLDDDEFQARMARWLELAYPGRPPLAATRAAGRSHLELADAGVGLIAPLASASAGILVNSTAARHSLELDLPPLVWQPPIRVVPPGCPPVRRATRGGGGGRVRGPGRPLVASFGVVSMSKRPDLLVDAAALAAVDLVFVGPCPPILEEVIGHRAELRGTGGRVTVTGAVADDEWWGWMDRASVAVQLREHSSGELSAAVLDAFSAGVPVVTNLPAAKDYPEEAVSMLSGPEPEVVAARLDELLAAPAGLADLAAGGRAFAAAHQMSDLAEAVVAAVTA